MTTFEGGELHGRPRADEIYADLAGRMEAFKQPRIPVCLDLITVNPDHAPSNKYLGLKQRAARDLGIIANVHRLYSAEVAGMYIDAANASPNSRGIVLQLPFRDDESDLVDTMLGSIAPDKDVDGLNPHESPFEPATPKAILTLMEANGIDLGHGRVLVAGHGRLVGQPLTRMLVEGGANVTAVDEHTPSDERYFAANDADVIISAMGLPNALTPEIFYDMSRPRVLVDAGTAEKAGVMHGDVDDSLRRSALEHGWAVSPLKGGVGPLTVATLMEHVVVSAERQFAVA